MRKTFFSLCLLSLATLAATKPESSPAFSVELTRQANVAAALRYVDEHQAEHLREWIYLTEIPAPSKHEAQRAAYVKTQMEQAGLSDVQLDELGNCVGTRKGTGEGPTVVFAAHLDTVHPAGTPLKVRRAGDKLFAPGVFDNSASLANLLTAIRALNQAHLKTSGDLIFIATVQEELGLHGMRHWLQHNRARADLVVALDGPLGPVSYGALGIKWLKFSYSAAGSHTVTSTGKPHPARAVARAIQDIYAIRLPDAGATPFADRDTAVYNVGMLGGGTVYNAAPQEAFFTIDIRANDPAVFKSLIERITRAAQRAAQTERVTYRVEQMMDFPAGGSTRQLAGRRAHPLVQTAVAVLTFLRGAQTWPVQAIPLGSTDANAAVELGIPAIAVGRGLGGGEHTLGEWADIPSTQLGTKQIILLAASMARVTN